MDWAGNDNLSGYGGSDELYGGDGRDTLYADPADSLIDGGVDNDPAHLFLFGTLAG